MMQELMDNFEDEFTQAFSTVTLRGDRVTLIGLCEHDSEGNDGPMSAAAVFRLVQESEDFLAEHLPWVRGVSQADIAKRIRSWVFAEQYGQGGCWGIFENSPEAAPEPRNLAGFIMLEVNVKNHSANVSYWLSKKYAGRGLASEALALLSRFSFDTLNLNRLELSASVYNPKSAAVAIRCGFQEEGVSRDFERINGIFVDHRRFSKLSRDV
ncbi:MAG: GNAT family N-acetyltransferase [Fibrobacter sp.]|nr:GNAT family N-acetyltransferase [Fibrobacter sp.]